MLLYYVLYFVFNFFYFQNISTVFLKANIEYLRGNYKKAVRLLNSVTSENLDFKYDDYITILHNGKNFL